MKDGGPAFPFVELSGESNADFQLSEVTSTTTQGMSLRDYFAAGESTPPPFVDLDDLDKFYPHDIERYHKDLNYRAKVYAEALAKWKFICADAMLFERSKEV